MNIPHTHLDVDDPPITTKKDFKDLVLTFS